MDNPSFLGAVVGRSSQSGRNNPTGKIKCFLAGRTRVLGKEFATDRGRLVSRPKMAVFLPR